MARARLPGWRASDDDATRVVALYRAGTPVAALAIRFGRCEDWVRRHVYAARADSLPCASTSARPVVAFAAASL